jgi:DNA helicase-2/ATP-dependent DNA helicase PcrA
MLEGRYADKHWDARKRDFDSLVTLAEGRSSITEFVEEYLIDPIHVSQIGPSESDCVIISTIHSAKGLEAKRVFVSGVHPGNYPHERSVGRLADIEEERRVLYVALTRAKDHLILTGQLRSSAVYGALPASDGSGGEDNDLIDDANYASLLFFLAEVPKKLVLRSAKSGHAPFRGVGRSGAAKEPGPLTLGPSIS